MQIISKELVQDNNLTNLKGNGGKKTAQMHNDM